MSGDSDAGVVRGPVAAAGARHRHTTKSFGQPSRRPNAIVAPALVIALLGGCSADGGEEQVVLLSAYGTSAAVVVEGRLVAHRTSSTAPDADDGPLENLERLLAIFTEAHIDDRAVSITLDEPDDEVGSGLDEATAQTVTDDDGFFRATLRSPLADGWVDVVATADASDGDTSPGASIDGGALVVPPGNILGIISDVDDTVLVTEVAELRRMVGNTALRNPLQRDAVPGVAALYARTLAVNPSPAAAPMFYLSASPRQLNDYLTRFLDANAFPRGVLLTRRIGFGADDDPIGDTPAYKSARINDILAAVPHARFVLVGDDGESDPAIFAAVRERYPERIEAVWIRRTQGEDGAPLPPGQVPLLEILGNADP